MQGLEFKAFTLVELIVVITIVGILSTVGFVSYSGYLSGARDSNRISQMVKLSDSLQVYSATKLLPLPDNYVEVTASGTIIGYQGEVGIDVLETIDYTNGGTDPKDGSYYSYYLTKDRESIQIMALMEEETLTAQIHTSYAADYSNRYPKVYGRKLGIFTEVNTNTPIHQLTTYSTTPFDVVNETGEFISHISDEEKISGTGSALQESIINGSCKRIKQTGGVSGNGIYTINPGGTGNLTVYCEMETAGGGWTLVGQSHPSGDGSALTTLFQGSLDDDSAPYSISTELITYDTGMLATYTSGRDIEKYKFTNSAGLFLIHTWTNSQITGGAVDDGYNGEQGMIFVK